MGQIARGMVGGDDSGPHYDIAAHPPRKGCGFIRSHRCTELSITTFTNRLALISLLGIILGACSLSPLHRKIKVGQEPFVVFVATGPDGKTDLFASTVVGGTPVRLTFTALDESMPRLTPHGDMVAFLRERTVDTGQDLVVMNLLSGAERLLELPRETGAISAIGWSGDQATIHLQGGTARWRVAAPPAPIAISMVTGADAAGDSALMVILGTPAFARAEQCVDGGVCVIGPDGTATRVSGVGNAPFRWGSDSLAWFEEEWITVRPLGPGSARRLDWSGGVEDPREGSYAEP